MPRYRYTYTVDIEGDDDEIKALAIAQQPPTVGGEEIPPEAAAFLTENIEIAVNILMTNALHDRGMNGLAGRLAPLHVSHQRPAVQRVRTKNKS